MYLDQWWIVVIYHGRIVPNALNKNAHCIGIVCSKINILELDPKL